MGVYSAGCVYHAFISVWTNIVSLFHFVVRVRHCCNLKIGIIIFFYFLIQLRLFIILIYRNDITM